MEGVFDSSQSIRCGDKRSYTNVLKRTKEVTSEELLQYHKNGVIELGRLHIVWINAFGEQNIYSPKSIFALHSASAEVFSLKLVEAPTQLYVEEPRTVTLRITNVSPSVFRLKFYIKEDETKTIAINALSHQVKNKEIVCRSLNECCLFRALTFRF